MSEQTGTTQPNHPVKEDDTQPIKPVKKTPRWRSILISIFGFLLLMALGGFAGYSTGIGDRVRARDSVITKQLAEQFQYALVDIEFGRYEAAKQRLEFIITNDPSYPGAQEKLTEVLVKSSIPTATATVTVTSTPDFSGAESAYQRAQQLILAQDWPGALSALDTIRKLDPTYKTAQVDGMYYFALRNYGHDLITRQGNLEGGIYQLTLAERFGPLDNTAVGLREGARLYITGASFWELDWGQAVAYFTEVGSGWPSMWDGTMSAAERLHIALLRYGDQLYEQQQYCSAVEQYIAASAFGDLDSASAHNYSEANLICNPPTATPTATLEVVGTTAVPPTDVPTEPPTETPTP
jgi:tetratricopeptide (TPR) repeat protein